MVETGSVIRVDVLTLMRFNGERWEIIIIYRDPSNRTNWRRIKKEIFVAFKQFVDDSKSLLSFSKSLRFSN